MLDQEKLQFKIGLSRSTVRKAPEFSIKIDGVEILHKVLNSNLNSVEYFDFEHEISEGNHVLEIILMNKVTADTVKDENENIVDDLILHIKSIEIEGIEMDSLKWSLSNYYPIYPEAYQNEQQKQVKEVKNCVDLGWNGSWQFPFSSPFYIWLLENI